MSTSTAGRILRKLMDRGVVVLLPTLADPCRPLPQPRCPACPPHHQKAEFEPARAERGLTLSVLPPKRPQLNGAVERVQGSWRHEFYACFDLPHRIDKLQAHVDAFAHRYNHNRPHQALGDQTPADHLATISRRPPASPMS